MGVANSYAGTPKNFQSTHIGYRAHRVVIFAIAWHLVIYLPDGTNKSGTKGGALSG